MASGYDESSQCAGAFRILRQMVSAFMKDVAVYQNIFADQQLSHLFRWLKDPHSLLYEPSLKRILDNLISKMFNQLVNEFQRLGSHVVYASLSRIIVCTKRRSVSDASAYVEFVVNSMRNKELFHSIDFDVKQAYKILLWMDPVRISSSSAAIHGSYQLIVSWGMGVEDFDHDTRFAVKPWRCTEDRRRL